MEKRKLWPWFLGGFVVLLGGAAIAGRIALGALVQSDEFRQGLNEVLERGARTLLPTALTEVGTCRLEGLWNLELGNVTVRSGKHLLPVLEIRRLRISPQFSAAMFAGIFQFDVDALLGGGGRVTVRGGMVNGAVTMGGYRADAPHILKLDGIISEVNLVTPVALFLAEHAGPNAELTRGLLSGTFSFEKPFGEPSDHGKKSGRLAARLDTSTFVVGGAEKARTLEVPPLDLDVELEDYAVRIMKPIAFTEKSGRATISGSLTLPLRRDREPQWDLDILIDGDQGLASALARILRCRAPERSQGFKVSGSVTGPECPKSGA